MPACRHSKQASIALPAEALPLRVFVPEAFATGVKRFAFTYNSADFENAVELMGKTDTALAVADIGASAAVLRELPEVSGMIATIGYCFVARLTFMRQLKA